MRVCTLNVLLDALEEARNERRQGKSLWNEACNDLDGAQKEIDRLKAELEKEQLTNDGLTLELQQAREERDCFERGEATGDHTITQLRARVAELERERDEAREDATFGERYVADQWREANATLRARVAELERERDRLKREPAAVRAMVAGELRGFKELKKEHTTLRTRLASLEAENGELREALRKIAYEPGHTSASHRDALDYVEKVARAALAKPEGGEKVPIREGQPRKPGKVAPEDVEIDSDN